MALASVHSRAQLGIEAPQVLVEVHTAPGLPKVSLVGLPETAVKESVERVRSAIVSSGYHFKPARITINLSPANLPKQGTRYDLPIAIATLKAMGQIRANIREDFEFFGELGLDGELRATGGLIPAILKAARENKCIFLPAQDANQARVLNCEDSLKGKIYAVSHLNELTAHLENRQVLEPLDFNKHRHQATIINQDLKEVQGQFSAKRALEIAASGFHNLLMMGPPGSGKSMLSERMPGIMPDFSNDELEVALSIHSVANRSISESFAKQRPFRAPHHSSSSVALVGGGRVIMPGEITLAHSGVLFLDELPEFKRDALEALRQPMETGKILISRAASQVEYPARFLLIAAMNGCPCGNLGSAKKSCTCTHDQILRYRAKVSGPLLDRIDIHLTIKPVEKNALLAGVDQESSTEVKKRVSKAFHRQIQRQQCPNSELGNQQLKDLIKLNEQSKKFLLNSIDRLSLSARSYHKILKLALTIADLADEELSLNHLAEAVSYRSGFEHL